MKKKNVKCLVKPIEKINKYALEYRERQRNLLLRREMINKKLFEILRELDPERINNDDVLLNGGKNHQKILVILVILEIDLFQRVILRE